jgi:hypothetical protein
LVSMIFSENRYPLFGIMLQNSSGGPLRQAISGAQQGPPADAGGRGVRRRGIETVVRAILRMRIAISC